MTRKELLTLRGLLQEISKKKLPIRTAFKVLKILKTIEPEVSAIEEVMQRASKEIADFEQERLRLCYKYAAKDSNGNPKVENGSFVIEDRESFNKEMQELKNKYKDKLENYARITKELEELLEEEPDVQISVKFKLEELEGLELSVSQLEVLYSLIEDEL